MKKYHNPEPESEPARINYELGNTRSQNRLQRREFLKWASAATAGLLTNPEKPTPLVESSPSLEHQIVVERAESFERPRVVPEYEQRLEQVIIAISSIYGYINPELVYYDLLHALPEYATVDVVISAVPEKQQAIKDLFLNQMGLKNNFVWHPIQTGIGTPRRIVPWAQDLGTPININGKKTFLVPMNLSSGLASRENLRMDYLEDIQGQTAIARRLSTDIYEQEAEQAQFFFQKGNVMFDEAGSRILIGHSDIDLTMAEYQQRGKTITPREVAEMISRQFGGAEVVIMGDRKQTGSIYHIDLGFLLAPNNSAVMAAPDRYARPKEKLDWPHYLNMAYLQEYYRQQLLTLGYKKPIEIPHSPDDLRNNYFSVNAVPYRDKLTGELCVIFPVFPGELKGDFEKDGPAEPERLQGKGRMAFEAFHEAGFSTVKPVRDFTHDQPGLANGDTHCIVNVLA